MTPQNALRMLIGLRPMVIRKGRPPHVATHLTSELYQSQCVSVGVCVSTTPSNIEIPLTEETPECV